jgi:hypothetical protein
MRDVVRAVLVAQEAFVAGLYVLAGFCFWRHRKILAERAEGRVAGIAGLLCFISISVRHEIVTWGDPLTIVEPLQFCGAIGVLWLWWKVLGVIRWREMRD